MTAQRAHGNASDDVVEGDQAGGKVCRGCISS